MTMLRAQDEFPTDELPLPNEIKYVNPEFKDGLISFKDGSRANGKFNISTLYHELLFIGDDGSIQALADNEQVDRVSIGGVLYFYDNTRYFGVVDYVGEVNLCVSKQLVFDDAKEGAYGMKSATVSVTNITQVQTAGSVFHYNPDIDYQVKEEPFINRKGKFQMPTKKLVLKAFSDKDDEIEAYIDQNDIDCTSLEDLKVLFEYIKTLY